MKKFLLSLMCGFLVIGLSTGCGKKEENNNEKNPEENIQKVDDTWNDWELSIDDIKIKLPMKYSEFIEKGFFVDESTLSYNIDYAELNENTSVGLTISNYGKTTYSNGTTNGISIVVYNPSNEKIKVKDSYIVGIEFIDGNYSTGEIKLKNNSRNTEVVVGKSTISDIEKAFGSHYQYDYSNTFHYYPDVNKDGVLSVDESSVKRFISLYCDEETQILDRYDFIYGDHGNNGYEWSITKSDNLNWNIPTGFSYLETNKFGTEVAYDSEKYRIHLLTYWKFANEYNAVTDYLNNKEGYSGKGIIIENSKYGNIFVIELDKYNYEDRYSYYAITEDGKYFMQIASKAKPEMTYQEYKESGGNITSWNTIYKNASKMTTDEVINIFLGFLS